jgi:ryanodine receptor 2
MVGLKIEKGRATKDDDRRVLDHLEHHLELCAEAEHIGWMKERRDAGWRYGRVRDNGLRVHPLMVPYDELPESERSKDRDAIRNYPQVLRIAGYRVVFP